MKINKVVTITNLTPLDLPIGLTGYKTLYVLSLPVENFFLINSILSSQEAQGYLTENLEIS